MSSEIDFRMRRLVAEASAERLVGDGRAAPAIGHALMALGRRSTGSSLSPPAGPRSTRADRGRRAGRSRPTERAPRGPLIVSRGNGRQPARAPTREGRTSASCRQGPGRSPRRRDRRLHRRQAEDALGGRGSRDLAASRTGPERGSGVTDEAHPTGGDQLQDGHLPRRRLLAQLATASDAGPGLQALASRASRER